jgi:hypothetical protein
MSEAVITQKAQERLITLFPLSIFWMEAGAHLCIRLFHKATITCWQGPSHRQSDLAEGIYRKRAPAPGYESITFWHLGDHELARFLALPHSVA